MIWRAIDAFAVPVNVPALSGTKTVMAIFAGECFGSVEVQFEKLPGILAAEAGYTGEKTVNPSCRQVSAGSTDHAEPVRVIHDPERISYAALLDRFWRHIGPTAEDSRFCDKR
jgi:peptide-methionine (S)-S-oxide reductase